MKDLLLMMSEAMPESFLYEQLEKEVSSYRLSGSLDSKDKAKTIMMLIMSKEACEKAGGSEKLMEKTDLMDKGYNLLNTNQS